MRFSRKGPQDKGARQDALCRRLTFSLINSNFKLFVSEGTLPVFNDFFSKVYTSNSKESCEVVLGYDEKVLCPVYMEGIVTDEERECLLSVVDISSFKK